MPPKLETATYKGVKNCSSMEGEEMLGSYWCIHPDILQEYKICIFLDVTERNLESYSYPISAQWGLNLVSASGSREKKYRREVRTM